MARRTMRCMPCVRPVRACASKQLLPRNKSTIKPMNTTPPLQEDVGLLKGMGVNAGMYSSEDASHVVRFALDTAFLNKFTARQWGIVPKKPVVVQV